MMTSEIVLAVMFTKKESVFSPIRLQNELVKAAAIHQRYSNHVIARQKCHQLLDTSTLRGVSTSHHQGWHSLTIMLLVDLSKDSIITASKALNDSQLLVSLYSVPHHDNEIFAIIVQKFSLPPQKLKHIAYHAREAYTALYTFQDTNRASRNYDLT